MPEQKHSPKSGSKNGGAEHVIVGRNPVWEALEGDDVEVDRVYLQKGLTGRWSDRLRTLARKRGATVQVVPRARLDRLAKGAVHQGVAASTTPVAYLELEVLLNGIAANPAVVRETKPVLLMLDRIEDPRNYGAILRSAAAAGVAGVIVPTRHMAPLSTVAVKASAGAALKIPVARTARLTEAILQLKERGYWIFGAAGDGETPLWSADWDRPLVLVIGSEGQGIREEVRRLCDHLVSIPMAGPVESLNASVATGVICYEVLRDRFHRAAEAE